MSCRWSTSTPSTSRPGPNSTVIRCSPSGPASGWSSCRRAIPRPLPCGGSWWRSPSVTSTRCTERLGVLLTDADLAPESLYNDRLPDGGRGLERAGLAVIDDGALCVFPPGFTGRDGHPAAPDRAELDGRVRLRRHRPRRPAVPHRRSRRPAHRLRGRRSAGAAPRDGVRRRPDGGMVAGRRSAGRARVVRVGARRRRAHAADAGRGDDQADRPARRGGRACRGGRDGEEPGSPSIGPRRGRATWSGSDR